MRDLQVMQNKAAQVVTLSPPRAERTPMYDRLGWLTVTQLIFYHSVLAIFKMRSSKEPEYLANVLVNDSRNGRIIIPNKDIRLTQNSFTMRGAESWNSLPEDMRKCPKLSNFKKFVKVWIAKNVPRFLE